MTAPLCKDCAHFMRQAEFKAAGFFIARVSDGPPRCKLTDHVDGSGKHGRTCESERRFALDYVDTCGPGGRNFKARE